MAMDLGDHNQEPIIIKKPKKGGGGHHGGAWKVAYADFVTAMMALFIVLWIMGQDSKVKEAVAGYFKDPLGYNIGQGQSFVDEEGKTSLAPKVLDEEAFREREKAKLEAMGQELSNQLKGSEKFDYMKESISIEIVEEGLKIEIMDSKDDVFFEIGTATLKKKPKELLLIIASELSKLNNKLIIEGHTDSRAYSGGNLGYTNYELSADRANSARRALIEGGLNMEQIDEIRGYAANRLKVKEDSLNPANRRISIIVKYNENI